MGEHTPGPWLAYCQDVTEGLERGDSGIRYWTLSPEGKYRGEVASVHAAEHIGGITLDERDANARLIAAAPELLEALESVLANCISPHEQSDGYHETCVHRDDVAQIKAAIAKARAAS